MRFLLLCCFGFTISAANLLPTRCGAMVSLGMQLYERVVHALAVKKGHGWQSCKLLLPLAIGAIGALFALKAFYSVFANALLPAAFFSVGLVLGGLPSVIRRVAMRGHGASCIWAMGAAFLLLMFFGMRADTQTAFAGMFPPVIRVFLGGALLGVMMILPGAAGMKCVALLSGAQPSQPSVMAEAAQPLYGLVMILGCILGLVAAARVLDHLFERFPANAYGAVLGLMLGSLVMFMNVTRFTLNMQGAIAIALLLFGMMLSLLMEKLRDFFLNRSALTVNTVADF